MTDPFEYDVFLAFSTADEEIVKPFWQELCANGLRVFWSDSTLKKEVGNSWFEVIEKSLTHSRHMLLVCSENSMNSKWVQREYRAFFDTCYTPGSRRLIPVLTRGFAPDNLPIFLRTLQIGKLDDPGIAQQMIQLLGGINSEKLVPDIQVLQETVDVLLGENQQLKEQLQRNSDQSLNDQLNSLLLENQALKEQLSDLIKRQEEMAKDTGRKKVFISYSHRDREWLKRVQTHLKVLEYLGVKFSVWDDTQIMAGTKWRDAIEEALSESNVAILLVSTDFLVSSFIQEKELPKLLKAASNGGTTILPVILKPCLFNIAPELSAYQSVNDPAQPLSKLLEPEQDEILVSLAARIRDLVS
jgi:hypothetical protein